MGNSLRKSKVGAEVPRSWGMFYSICFYRGGRANKLKIQMNK